MTDYPDHMHWLFFLLLAVGLLVSPLLAADIETIDGRLIENARILEEQADSLRFEYHLDGQRMAISLPKRIVHRLRLTPEDDWRVITAKKNSTAAERTTPVIRRRPEQDDEDDQPAPTPTTSVSPDRPSGWRGDGSGLFASPVPPPTDWRGGHNLRWKVALPSWSSGSPIVVGDRVFCTAEPDRLLCFDRADGSLRWQSDNNPADLLGPEHPDPGPRDPKDLRGWTMATTVSDGTRVWNAFGQGLLVCHDLEGQRLWSVPLDTDSRWGSGLSASPLLHGDLLLQQSGSGLQAFDKNTGEKRWRAAGSSHLLGTGALMDLAGRMHVVGTEGQLVRLSDGATLCGRVIEKPWKGWGPSVVVAGDRAVFHLHGDPKNSTCVQAWRYQADGSHELLWQFIPEAEPKYNTRMGNSPLIVDDLFYAVTDGGHLTVVDMADGSLVYDHQWSKHAYSSLISAGPFIYATGRDEMHVFQPGRSYQPIADFPHGFAPHEGGRSTIIPSPFVADGALYFRDRTHLWCIAANE